MISRCTTWTYHGDPRWGSPGLSVWKRTRYTPHPDFRVFAPMKSFVKPCSGPLGGLAEKKMVISGGVAHGRLLRRTPYITKTTPKSGWRGLPRAWLRAAERRVRLNEGLQNLPPPKHRNSTKSPNFSKKIEKWAPRSTKFKKIKYSIKNHYVDRKIKITSKWIIKMIKNNIRIDDQIWSQINKI
jgi:hypothetical protein